MKKEKKKTKLLYLRLDSGMYGKLVTIAKSQYRTISSVAKQAIGDFLAKMRLVK